MDGRRSLRDLITAGPGDVSTNAKLVYAFWVLHLVTRREVSDERNQEDPVEDGLRQLSRGRRRRRGLTAMPLYEYQCVKCGRKMEVIQSFSDSPPAKCLHCGGTLAKLLSSPAFQFKGSGFYATDYGKSGGKPEDSSKEKREILRR